MLIVTQTNVGIHEIIPIQEHYEETQRLVSIIEKEMVPLYMHNAMQKTHYRELDIYHETLNERLRTQERSHQTNLHNLTQAFFTKSSRCWHANRQCLKRFTTQEIQEENHCTLCSHTLGGISTPST